MVHLKRPDILFSLTGLLIPVIEQMFYGGTLDVAVHDTYLIIAQLHIALALMFFYLFMSLVYFFFLKISRPLNRGMGYAHYVITSLCLLIFIFPLGSFFQPVRYKEGTDLFNQDLNINDYLMLVVFGFVSGQLIFLVNIIQTLFRPDKTV